MLQLTFHIRRKKFYYVVSIYIPTILITILSWVSFWIPRNSPPARVALGITTVLALTTLIFGIQASMPKVSYVKAIDWFLCVSFLYVFAALVEYPSSTFVKSQAKKLTRKGTNILRKVKGLKDDPEDLSLSRTRYGSTDKVGLKAKSGISTLLLKGNVTSREQLSYAMAKLLVTKRNRTSLPGTG